MVTKPTVSLPGMTLTSARTIAEANAPKGTSIPQWAIIAGYQNGRYDEASSETFQAAFE